MDSRDIERININENHILLTESDSSDGMEEYNRSPCENKVQIRSEKAPEEIVKSLDVNNAPSMFRILLKPHTNLNKPPSNWLHGSSRRKSHAHQGTFPFENFFSSLSMANQFLDLTGIVDVISDSKNIKKLLKMTLSKSNVSMIVHRVNNTLLLDNFDIHSLLKQKTGTWELFRRFYFEKVDEDKLSVIERKNKSRDHLQSQNMFSKFLYYCFSRATEQQSPDSQANIEDQPRSDSNLLNQRTVVWNFEDIRMLIGTDLPIFGGDTHPCVSLKLRDMRKPISVLTGLDNWLDNLMCNVPDLAMCYHDNGFVQSYELLKTEDIPNCPNCRFSPNVIKDIAQNILSFLKSNATKEGHTYWLFKAHDADVVKLYDLTTLCCNDNPDEPIENPFTVPVGVLLYRLARNLRIRQKCPSKGKKAKVIKKLLRNSLLLLDRCKHYQIIASCHYFLSDLFVCDHLEEEPSDSESNESDIDLSSQNDFSDEDEPRAPTIKKSHSDKSATSFIKVEALNMHTKSTKKQPHLSKKKETKPQKNKASPVKENEDLRIKFSSSFRHISKAFENIEKFHTSLKSNSSSDFLSKDNNFGESKHSRPFEELAQCNPNEAIPLHYSPLKPMSSTKTDNQNESGEGLSSGGVCETKDILAKSLRDIESPFSNTSFDWSVIDANHWLVNSKIFLLRKATLAFIKRAKFKLDNSQEVDSSVLQDGFNAVKCYCAFSKMISSTFSKFESSKQRNKLSEEIHLKCRYDPFLFASIAKVLGDCYYKYAIHKCKVLENNSNSLEDEQNVLDLVESYIRDQDIPFSFLGPSKEKECFSQSIDYYVIALSIVEDFDIFPISANKRGAICSMPKFVIDLLKRKANACNECGKYYIQDVVLTDGSLNENWPKLIHSAQDKFKESCKIFKQLNDNFNAAIVLLNESNCIRNRMKLIRNNLPPQERTNFTQEERIGYQQAEACLSEGLLLLENPKKNKDLWETFMWELSSINVHVGSLMQDCISNGTCSNEFVKEMVGQFELALKHCTFENNSSRYVTAQYRKGHIHHRLGAFYHCRAMKEKSNQTVEDFVEIYKHYELSFKTFITIKAAMEFLIVLLELVVLEEMVYKGNSPEIRFEKAFEVFEMMLLSLGPLTDVIDTLQETLNKISGQSKLSKSSPSMLTPDELISDIKNICETVKLVERFQNKLPASLLRVVLECRNRSGESDQLNQLKSLYNKCLICDAISIPLSGETKYWLELSAQTAAVKKYIIFDEKMSTEDNNFESSSNDFSILYAKSLSGLHPEDILSVAVISISRIRSLLTTFKSLVELLCELKKPLPLIKAMK